MTLETCLNALPTETLQKIYENRGIGYETNEAMPKQRASLLAKVLRDLRNGFSHSAAIREIDARMLRLLQLAVIHEHNEHVHWSDLWEGAGGRAAEHALQETFVRLEAWGLLFQEEDGTLLLQSEVKRQTPLPLSERYGLEQCLLNETAVNLKKIARGLGVNPDGSKAEVAPRVRAAILEPEPGRRPYDRLPSEEKRVFDALMEYGGVAPLNEFARRYVPNHRLQPYYAAIRSSKPEISAIDRLLETGMVYLIAYAYSFSQQLVIPRDIVRALKNEDLLAFWTGSAPVLTPLEEPFAGTHRNDFLLRDCTLFLASLSRVDALKTQSGLMNKTALKSIAKLYFNENDLYTAFLYALLTYANLILAFGDRGRYVITQQGMDWLEAPPAVQWLLLVGAWVENPLWIETREEPLNSDSDRYGGRSGIELRGILMEALPAIETDFFFSLRSLTEAMIFRVPLLLANLGNHSELSTPQQYFGKVVGESLLWLGLVEAAYQKSEAPASEEAPKRGQKTPLSPPVLLGFRLTPSGMAILKQNLKALHALTPQEEGFYLQPNGDLILPPYLKALVRYRLLLYADPVLKGGGAFQMTRDSLRRALDDGETGKEILAFLQSHSRSGVPQPIEYLVNEVAGKHGHIRIGSAKFYLQVDDPVLLKELRSRKELAPYLKNEIAETAAAVEVEDIEKFMRELRRAGYAPVRDEPAKKKRKPPKAPNRASGNGIDLKALEAVLGEDGVAQLLEELEELAD